MSSLLDCAGTPWYNTYFRLSLAVLLALYNSYEHKFDTKYNEYIYHLQLLCIPDLLQVCFCITVMIVGCFEFAFYQISVIKYTLNPVLPYW